MITHILLLLLGIGVGVITGIKIADEDYKDGYEDGYEQSQKDELNKKARRIIESRGGKEWNQ